MTTTFYIRKTNTDEMQTFPIPEDLTEWYVTELTDTEVRDMIGKEYNPETDTFEPSLRLDRKEQLRYRRDDFFGIALPLFFEWQVDPENTTAEAAFRAALSSINAKYPLPTEV